MQISKKLYATLIITVLTLSTLMAAIPMASAEIVGDPFLCAASPPGSTSPITTGPPGTSVAVVGNATGGAADPFATVTVYWDALSGTVLGTGAANNLGEYRITVTIPEAIYGTHWIVVNDGETESGGAAFNVTATLSVASIPPAYFPPTLALPGDSLTVTGKGYAPNDDITLFLNQTTDPSISYLITTPIFHTNGTGSFSGTIVVPAIPMANFDMYVFNGTDEAGNSATSMVSIDYYITCYPGSGPTGITIWIFGRIAEEVTYEIRFNNSPIATGTTDNSGSYFEMYTIPGVLSEATYEIAIWWGVNNRTTSFTVTPTPTITLGATTGVAGATVTISGVHFTGGAKITLYFGTTVVNSTDMDDRFGPTPAYGPSAGTFSENFVVPSLAPGTYVVSVVDSNGAASAAGVFFTILPTPETTVALRGATYYPMDMISFNIWTTEGSLGTITVSIYDPSSQLWWNTSDWTLTTSDDATYKSVIFQNQGADDYNQMRIILPADCPLGVWNWTITYTPTSTGLLTKATGLFVVVVKPSMQTLVDQLNANTTTVLDEIDDCCANLTALLTALDAKITAIDGSVATVSTTVGEMNVALAALDAKITGIATAASVSSLDSKVSGLASDIVTIKTSIGGVTTSLASLDTVIGGMYGDVLTIKTSIGTINGTITEMDGTIATIVTDIGTLRMDVAEMKTDVAAVQTDVDESLPVTVDMMPVWIAVVLSLIAAIAAIFAVVTIRQKIAG